MTKRPRTSWDTVVDPEKSPLKGLSKLDPPIVITDEAREEASVRLEVATRPYRTPTMMTIVEPPPHREPSDESLRTGAREAARRSSIYAQPTIYPREYLKRRSARERAVMCDELSAMAEYEETLPDGARIFLGEFPNGHEWQVRIGVS